MDKRNQVLSACTLFHERIELISVNQDRVQGSKEHVVQLGICRYHTADTICIDGIDLITIISSIQDMSLGRFHGRIDQENMILILQGLHTVIESVIFCRNTSCIGRKNAG